MRAITCAVALCVCCIFALPLGVEAKDIYTWTDENGVVHYSDLPPRDPSVEPKGVRVPEARGVPPAPAGEAEEKETAEPTAGEEEEGEGTAVPGGTFCGSSETWWSDQFAVAQERVSRLDALLQRYREALEEGKKAAYAPRYRVEGKKQPLNEGQFLKEIDDTEKVLATAREELDELNRKADLCAVPSILRQ